MTSLPVPDMPRLARGSDGSLPVKGTGTTYSRRRKPLGDRFWSKVSRGADTECWLWTDAADPDGYGRIFVGGKGGRQERAHRIAYELAKGPIPTGLTIDHLCRNRMCVNPSHLEPVTLVENIRRRPNDYLIGSRNPASRSASKGPGLLVQSESPAESGHRHPGVTAGVGDSLAPRGAA